eukprot:TRINITY_DN30985_c0_g1_i2.p1 TRINITY_DN30985_c0_g1~~TRINITY_DN30985_c0_g1_i2.p1  ORF type:complete len:751 (+),score=75.17 TRINITY_DN30985_c0_g1_i2:63-2315(+)
MAPKSPWLPFLRRVGERPDAFYESCVSVLLKQDLYHPEHLSLLDPDILDEALENDGATMGVRAFLGQAVHLARQTAASGGLWTEVVVATENGSSTGSKTTKRSGNHCADAVACEEKIMHVSEGKEKDDVARAIQLEVVGPRPVRARRRAASPSWFSLSYAWDDRAFVLHRVLLGMVMLKEVLYFIAHFDTFMSDSSFTPRSVSMQALENSGGGYVDLLNLYLSCGGYGLLIVLFLHALVAWALIFGRGGRLMYLVGLMFCNALHQRTSLLAFAGMRVQRSLLAWGMFRPDDEDDEEDAADSSERNGAISENGSTDVEQRRRLRAWLQSLARHAITLQLCYVYGLTGLAKTDKDHWMPGGGAVRWLMYLGCYVRPSFIVDWLKTQAGLCRFLLALIGLLGFHAGILLTTRITDFTLVMFAAIAIFLPAPAVDLLIEYLAPLCRHVHERFGDFVRSLRSAVADCCEYMSPSQHSRLPRRKRQPTSKEGNILLIVSLLVLVLFYMMGVSHTHNGLLVEQGLTAQRYFCPTPVLAILQFTGLLHWWFMFAPRVTGDAWLQMYANSTSGTLYDMMVDGLPQRYAEIKFEDAVPMWPRPFGDQRWLGWSDSLFNHQNKTAPQKPVSDFYRPAFFRKMCQTRLPNGDSVTGLLLSRFKSNTPFDEITNGTFPYEYYWWHYCKGEYREQTNQMIEKFLAARADKEALLPRLRPHYPYKAPSQPWWFSIAITGEDWLEIALWYPSVFVVLCLGATAIVE